MHLHTACAGQGHPINPRSNRVRPSSDEAWPLRSAPTLRRCTWASSQLAHACAPGRARCDRCGSGRPATPPGRPGVGRGQVVVDHQVVELGHRLASWPGHLRPCAGRPWSRRCRCPLARRRDSRVCRSGGRSRMCTASGMPDSRTWRDAPPRSISSRRGPPLSPGPGSTGSREGAVPAIVDLWRAPRRRRVLDAILERRLAGEEQVVHARPPHPDEGRGWSRTDAEPQVGDAHHGEPRG